MKVGVAVSMLNVGEKPDSEIYRDDLKLADLAEPLGFDSIWSVEHHFTGYAMVPNVVQLLTYFAGRSSFSSRCLSSLSVDVGSVQSKDNIDFFLLTISNRSKAEDLRAMYIGI